jgi:hypothetical protein
MAINYPGPLELRFYIITDGITHEHRVNADPVEIPTPGTALADIDLNRRNTTPTPASSAVTAYVALLDDLFATVTNIDSVGVWTYEEGTFDATFITATPLVVAGVVGPTYQPARQDILTFRTFGGGQMRWGAMESALTLDYGKYAPSGGAAAIDAMLAFILSDGNWLLARDNTYPLAGISYLVGQNEKVFRQRYR